MWNLICFQKLENIHEYQPIRSKNTLEKHLSCTKLNQIFSSTNQIGTELLRCYINWSRKGKQPKKIFAMSSLELLGWSSGALDQPCNPVQLHSGISLDVVDDGNRAIIHGSLPQSLNRLHHLSKKHHHEHHHSWSKLPWRDHKDELKEHTSLSQLVLAVMMIRATVCTDTPMIKPHQIPWLT